MKRAALGVLFLAALAAAFFFRLTSLDLRPMHHDEANQAVKFGALLERGEYRYDKTDHHGPALYYLTLPAAKAAGRAKLADLDEMLLRTVPAVFGGALLLLLLFFGRSLADEARALAALFLAVSPAMTYYSRFYIQEMCFAFFVLGFLVSLWRYLVRPDGEGSLFAGVFAGLMAATKETAVIVFAAAALGVAAVLTRERLIAPKSDTPIRRRFFARHFIILLIVAAAVAAAFFSSFGSHPAGIKDAADALKIYVEKGSAAPGFHGHPFFYYLGILAGSASGGLVWTELLVLLLGAAGMVFVFLPHRRSFLDEIPDPLPVDRSLGLFLVVYTLAATLAFSLLGYKTPWNMIPFYLGWLILAGIGGITLFRMMKTLPLRAAVLLVLAAGLGHLAGQSRLACVRYPADPRNPYVYAQTSPDFLKLVGRVEALAAVHPEGRNLLVKVVAEPYEQWPLPWYLREYKTVGYWTEAEAAGNLGAADLVIASAERAEDVENALGRPSIVEHYGLRPGVLLTLFIPPGLWEAFMKSRG
ncbi:MAG TPA: TIGR03663 family protein [Candidatus Aminicenantes bacterium]|nr:TIGR03663 family protein [Candidatus Aminicenantes bacterium]HPN16602.1 TIGR03663 family protein [Candidatus Aminicenantes bacterium]